MHSQFSAVLCLHKAESALWYFFSDAESTDISALAADDFTDVTLAMTLLMFLWSVRMASRVRKMVIIMIADHGKF